MDRLVGKIDFSGDCWEWKAQLNAYGYGIFHVSQDARPRQQKAHRVVYEMFVEPVPAGLELDHLCRNRACVNPDHLEPVTTRENLLRGDTITAAHAAAMHCPQGHPYDAANTYISPVGTRRCRRCNGEAQRRYRREKRTAA